MARFTIKREDAGSFRSWNDNRAVAIWWLGQAGFLIRFKETTILIDPYLSDVLALKYNGKKYPHKRMMPPPVNPETLKDIDFYLSSHSHSDHMDPGLIPHIAENCPNCRFILPEACRDTALSRGMPEGRMILLDDGNNFSAGGGIIINSLTSAHEEPEKDDSGRSLYLGYVISFGPSTTIYHSGDCVPYPGLVEKLSGFTINLALLPVNGRSPELSADGVAGNFTFDEAVELADKLNIAFMIPHHYGMFEFNTISPDSLKQDIKRRNLEDRIYPAELNTIFKLEG